jgi:hypothetical protein
MLWIWGRAHSLNVQTMHCKLEALTVPLDGGRHLSIVPMLCRNRVVARFKAPVEGAVKADEDKTLQTRQEQVSVSPVCANQHPMEAERHWRHFRLGISAGTHCFSPPVSMSEQVKTGVWLVGRPAKQARSRRYTLQSKIPQRTHRSSALTMLYVATLTLVQGLTSASHRWTSNI